MLAKSISIGFVLIFQSLNLICVGQNLRDGCFFRDCPIQNAEFVNKLSYLDSLAYLYVSVSESSYDPLVIYHYNKEEVFGRKKLLAIPERSVRIYYRIASDLKDMYIIGVTKNYLIQSKLDSGLYKQGLLSPIGKEEFISEPLFFLPLSSYQTFTKESEIKTLLTESEGIIINSLIDWKDNSSGELENVINLKPTSAFQAFDDRKIKSTFFNIDAYKAPNDKIGKLSNLEVKDYLECKSQSVPYSYNSYLNNICVSIDFSIERKEFDIDPFIAYSKVHLSFSYIGFQFLSCDGHSVGKVLWFKWSDFLNDYNDKVFEQEINYFLISHLASQLIKNKY